ncbi:MAG: hypothetical protein EXR11_11470 [Rhodospirillaceae bacterium]|nr:hypothetical protein [Rhodospirillaceae bacterium]
MPSISHKGLMIAAVALTMLPVIALAQDTNPEPASAMPAAKPVPKSPSPYDEEGARMLIATHGFYGVGRLKMNSAGLWSGTAIQFGRIVTVTVDASGNFTGVQTSQQK